MSNALQRSSEKGENSLLTPVHIPEDPQGILKENHPAMNILANSSIVVQRQLELMNVMVGFEQANRYVIMDPQGNHIGYLAEQEHGLGSTVARQAFRTHRSFTTHVFDRNEKEVLRFHRPFSWISSRIRVYDATHLDPTVSPSSSTALQGLSAGSIANQTSAQVSGLALSDMRIIGEAQQQWAPLRRKYNLFLHRNTSELLREENAPQLTSGELPISKSTALQPVDEKHPEGVMAQWAFCDEPFLSWDFSLLSADGQLIGSVNRNWAGIGRELFTDTGVYVLRMDSASLTAEPKHMISGTAQRAITTENSTPGMTLDQRAVMLATAVSVDFDYFSRHSGGTGFMPMWFPWWGGEAAAGGAEAGAGAGAAGAEVSAAGTAGEVAGAARGVGTGVGASEGAIAGAGTMAGYEAMRGARGDSGNAPANADDASPTAQDSYPWDSQSGQTPQQGPPEENVWGDRDPWGGPPSSGGGGGGDGGGSGGGDGGSWFDEFF
jgi:hypothetical protein